MLKAIRILLLPLLLCCGIVQAQINTPSGAVVPFGANQSYPYGIMPTNLPTGGTYGKSQDAANAYIEWKANYVVSCGSSPNRYRVKFDEPNRTVSEGIAYGMLLAAYAADKDLFDGLWNYYKANANGNGFLNWRIDGCSGVSGTNGATDADLDAAYALLVADNQWPSATTPYDYTTEASNMMNKIKQFEIHPSSFQAINGDGWGFGDNCRNPSYQSPAYYREFATKNAGNASAWNSAVTAGYNLLNANAHATTGLVSDWSNNNGVRNTCNGSPLGVPTDGYGYDASRNPWRMAQDAIWNNSTDAKALCTKIATYVNSKGAGNVRGPLYQDGNLYSGNQHNATFVSMFALPIMGTTATNQTLLNSMYTETKNVKDPIQNVTLSGYFGNTLRCVSLFMMTGNFWKLGTTSLPEINLKDPTLSIDNGTTYDFQNQQTIPPAATGKTITFTIQNLGFQTLTFGTPDIAITGTDAAQFILTESLPTSLAGNGSVTFTIQFRPTSTGTKNAVLTIKSNDADEANYVVNLTGIGTANTTSPNMTVRANSTTYNSGGTYAFGTITTSSTATAKIYLKNTGSAPLNITSATVTGTMFAKVSNPTSVAVGDSAAIVVTYTPTAAAAHTGTLVIVTNDPSVPNFTLNLTGTGAACATVLATVPVLYNFDEYKNMTVGYNSTPVQPDTANKYVNTANPSARVCSFKRGTTGQYSDQIRFTGCGNTITFAAGKPLLSMLVYSPVAGATVLMNLKNDAGLVAPYNSLYSAQATVAKANQWTRVYLDFTAAVGASGIKYLEIFLDPLNTNGVKIYYLDDIRFDTNPCTADVPTSGILQDYDDHRNMSLPFTPPGTFNEVAVNPNASGVNTSATVASYIRPSTGSPNANYQIIRYKTCGTLDLSAGKTIISMAIYSPKAGIPVVMSLKDNDQGNPLEIGAVTATTTKVNTWETLYFDFTAYQGNTTVKAIDLFIDPLATSIATVGDRTYYIDDIKYSTGLPCATQIPATGIFNDFDANRYVNLAFNPTGPINEFAANPSATGINTSATVASFVRPATVLPDVIRYKACGSNFTISPGKSVVSLHVRSANANAEVIVSLKKANGTTELAQAYATTTTANTWTELNFDFSDYIGSTEAAFMDIIVDPNGTNIGTVAARTYYLDNIRYTNKPEINVRNGSTNVLNGDNVTFASTLVGDSLVIPLTLINNGSADLTLSGIPALNITGTGAANFYIIQSPSFSTTVTGGSAVGFSVVFKPVSGGSKTAAIEIANNDGNENPYYINLIGTAVCTLPGAAGTITGATPICSGSTGNTYSIAAVAGATGYTWTVPAGSTITAGANTISITVTAGATSGNVTVTPTNVCGNGTAASKAITINAAPATPGAITGSTTVCSGQAGVTYSVATVAGASTYNWTVPAGSTITAGAGTNSITVTFGSTAGNVAVTATNTCGTSTASTAAVAVNTVPSAAGAITGTTTVCSGQTGVTYSIATVAGATGYNWTVPAGSTITAGANTTSITVTFGSTAGNVSITPTNTCGNGTASSSAITINAVPSAAGAITGTTTVCSGQTGVTYSIATVAGATGYNWTVPAGSTITAGANTTSITVTFGATAGNVAVTPTNTCGNGTASSSAITMNTTPSTPGSITGATAVCSGQTGVTYSVSTVAGATSYNWTLPAGATITAGSGTNSITVTFGSTAGNVAVTATNTCGTSASSTAAITINTVPSAAGTITGNATVCSGSTGNVYSISTVAGATGYNWTVPAGSTITAGANTTSITVTFGATAGNVAVTPTNTCGNGSAASKSVAISGSANPAGAITGSTTVCSGATGVSYSIATVSGATGYNWTVPAGSTITAGSGTNSITVTFGSTSGNVAVTPTSTCGNGASSSSAVTVNATPATPGSITGTTTVCSGQTGVTYSVATVAGATSYNWTVPAGATITAGGTSNSITVTFGSASGNVSVTATNTCGTSGASTQAVSVTTVPSAAGTITGSSTVCSGQTGVTYSIATVAGASSYNWTVPAGSTITAGANTTTITVSFGATAGNVSVTPTNSCGNGTAASKAITISGAANPAGAITGTTSLCSGTSGVTYSIASVSGASGYNWTVPSGSTITAGANTTSITVTFGSTSGDVTVTPVSTCGNGAAATLAITVNPAASAAGTISGNTNVCENTAGVSYSISSVAGATGYNWSVPSGATITSGTNTTSITVTFGTSSGNISVTPTSTCGNGTASSKSITVDANPSTANAGADLNVCSNGTVTLAATAPSTGSGTWSVVSGSGSFADASSATTVVTGATSGSVFEWTVANGTCATSSDNTILTLTTYVAANAGSDQTVTGTSASLSASPASGTWSTASSGVTFAPDVNTANAVVNGLSIGVYTFTWTIAANGPCAGSSDEVEVTVTATPEPNLAVEVSSAPFSNNQTVTFVDVEVNESGTPVTITLNNTGSAALNISSVVLSGADFQMSSVSTPTSIPVSGSAVSFTVTFVPLSGGIKNGSITVTTNDPNESSFVINLNGNGTTDVTAAQFANTIQLSPNPTTNSVVVDLSEGVESLISVRDVTGKLMTSQRGTGKVLVDISELAQGVYTFEIVQGENRAIKKVIKQ